MKKHTAQIATQTNTVAPAKPARMLFGISSDELKAVHGGGGVIINPPRPTTVTGG